MVLKISVAACRLVSHDRRQIQLDHDGLEEGFDGGIEFTWMAILP